MYHFYVCTPIGETRAMSAPILPRTGDSLKIDDWEVTISKILWVGNGSTLEDTPMVYVDHILADMQTLAEKIATLNGADHKIAAIKDYRAATGVGLKEAKEAIDDAFQHLFPGGASRQPPLSQRGI